MGKQRVLVLMGGLSEERQISLKTGLSVYRSLDRARFEVEAFDYGGVGRLPVGAPPSPQDLFEQTRSCLKPLSQATKELIEYLTGPQRPEVVFIALHGPYGEDGTLQGTLDLLGLPYTGSGVLASALALNKALSKRLFSAENIPTPPFILVSDVEAGSFVSEYLSLPLIVKPNRQGSTIGVTVVEQKEDLAKALKTALRFDREALIERFIRGREITASVLGNEQPQALPLIEIVPKSGFYDYHSKYTPGATEYIVPARLEKNQAEEAQRTALRAYKALGCSGFARVDMIACDDGSLWVLEVNTIPGMTETSLFPKAAAAAGLSFSQLLSQIIDLALEKRDEEIQKKE